MNTTVVKFNAVILRTREVPKWDHQRQQEHKKTMHTAHTDEAESSAEWKMKENGGQELNKYHLTMSD